MEPEIASKIKFAKYHSLRILKAMKAGEDPNLSNPVPELEEEPPLDPNDPEVRLLNGSSDPAHQSASSRQPSVVEVPDDYDRIQKPLAERSTIDESLHPSRAASVSPQHAQDRPSSYKSGEDYYQTAAVPDVSPLAQPSTNQTIADGGYFPTVPDTVGRAHSQNLPLESPVNPGSPPEVVLPDPSSLPPPGASGFHTSRPPSTESLHSFPPPRLDNPRPSADPVPKYPSAPPLTSVASNQGHQLPTPKPTHETPTQPHSARFEPVRRQADSIQQMAPTTATGQSQGDYLANEEAILKAQKHARWAISALNFEDVNTAVKELRGALESLGAN